MNRRAGILALVALSAVSFTAVAQQPTKVWRIGVLETTDMAANSANLNGFRQGMMQLGYVEGRNYVIEYRSAGGSAERFPKLAAELAGLKVDLILARGTPAAIAASKVSPVIPVVTPAIAVPLLVVASLARPGGNVTGLTAINSELQGKLVQLLREILPRIARIAALQNMGNPAVVPAWKEFESVAQTLGIQPLLLDVRKQEDLGPALERAARQRAEAVIVGADGLAAANGKLIVKLANEHRLPTIFRSREYVQAGGLMSYGVIYPDLYRRAASYIDRIFKGAKPGDLPMEQPIAFELVINLNTAKALGITIPQSVLLRADEVIQ